MKAVNLWKTLFCAALAITTFGACSDDDKDDEGGLPSITVNGEASATVAVKLDGGTTDAIEVVSTGSWALTFDDETASRLVPSQQGDGRQGQDDADFYGRQVGGCRKQRRAFGYRHADHERQFRGYSHSQDGHDHR